MAKKRRLSILKIKEIIRIKTAGLSNRQIAGSCVVSPSTVSEVLQRADEMGVTLAHAERLIVSVTTNRPHRLALLTSRRWSAQAGFLKAACSRSCRLSYHLRSRLRRGILHR